MTGITLTIHFPTEQDREVFLGWLCDGGGEQEFMQYTDTTVTEFDYSKALPGWGYNPEIDGEPVVVLRAED